MGNFISSGGAPGTPIDTDVDEVIDLEASASHSHNLTGHKSQ